MTTATKYDVAQVPESGSSSSRWALTVSPGGWATSVEDNLAFCFNHSAEDRIREAVPIRHESKTVSLKTVEIIEGEYRIVDARAVTQAVVTQPVRPGRFTKTPDELEGAGAMLDSFFLGGFAYVSIPDAKIYEALRDLLESIGATGRAKRRICDEVNRLILCRAGMAPR